MSSVNEPCRVCTVGTPVSTAAASAENGLCTCTTSNRSRASCRANTVCVVSRTMSLIALEPGAWSTTYSSLASVCESPVANSVTSCPASASPSASRATTHSIPPYPLGGTASHGGGISAILQTGGPPTIAGPGGPI